MQSLPSPTAAFNLDQLREQEMSGEGSGKRLLTSSETLSEPEPLNAFGVTNSDLKRLGTSVFGIIASFMIYGVFLEKMTKGKNISEIGLIFGLSVIYTIVARIILLFNGEKPLGVPVPYFLAIGFSYLAAMWCSTRALRFVNYPTQVLGKSCKAVPIVLMSTLMGKKYSAGQYVAILLIVGGVAMFNLFKDTSKDTGKASTTFGLVLVLISLGFDGLTGALEDKVISKLGWGHGKGTFQLMYYINFYSVPIAFCAVLLDQGGELSIPDAAQLMSVGTLGLAGAMGQFFIFYTLSHFGAVACSIITTCRKVLTIMFSVVYFGHHLTGMQFAGLGVSVCGFVVEVNEKKKKSKKAQAKTIELGVVRSDETPGKQQARV
jgi:UDP-galactose transporter B1